MCLTRSDQVPAALKVTCPSVVHPLVNLSVCQTDPSRQVLKTGPIPASLLGKLTFKFENLIIGLRLVLLQPAASDSRNSTWLITSACASHRCCEVLASLRLAISSDARCWCLFKLAIYKDITKSALGKENLFECYTYTVASC